MTACTLSFGVYLNAGTGQMKWSIVVSLALKGGDEYRYVTC